MRRSALLTLLVLAACVPGPRGDRPAPNRPAAQRPAAHRQVRPAPAELTAPQLRACYADLTEHGARYSPLPDQQLGGGCTQLGAVRLLDVGIPVRGLGPMKCRAADRFTLWVNEAVQKAALAWLDSKVTRIDSFGTYSCRPVNNVEGARLSEHGRANAVDVAGFVLADGRRITIKDGWYGADPNVRDFLRAVHKAACRRFGIVIGPDGDRHHQDHLHFDLGGNGPYCH
jgi:hypothetical protein